ncbi:MAG TPA: bifunctional diaminohydroxyphosphoribosylaminopyrimidine deaminase/5-amino-6-(5-phosphoribosylamino)uracil reductase RibD, partial [Flavobacteriales bacterium]|nr:bifunctional diaminohydroxyphosphoribosylaminopyrimidine deaminase/5-amino-6-(5-phosphoribosylamino)uracil reductase RibD [Flavobacteriales bacterium]
MENTETYMRRCFELASQGKGAVAPNPLVGCVIVKDGKIMAEGYHHGIGQNHAEVDAIEKVGDPELLKGATLYVNLEPCVHHGKTPPCCDRIIECGIKKVVISGLDPNEMVHGRGLEKLQSAGIEVKKEVLLSDEMNLNRRFRTYHEKKRPYVILKWAQSADHFMDAERTAGEKGSVVISSEESRKLVHLWRSQEAAIMVGTNTVLNDNPKLTTRLVKGKNPLRIALDRDMKIPADSKILSDGNPTLIYTSRESGKKGAAEFQKIDFAGDVFTDVLNDLYDREIQSVLVEGGHVLLESILSSGLWDEA